MYESVKRFLSDAMIVKRRSEVGLYDVDRVHLDNLLLLFIYVQTFKNNVRSSGQLMAGLLDPRAGSKLLTTFMATGVLYLSGLAASTASTVQCSKFSLYVQIGYKEAFLDLNYIYRVLDRLY